MKSSPTHLQWILSFFVEAKRLLAISRRLAPSIRSPVFVCNMRSFSGRRGRRPLPRSLIFTVGAIHSSPAFCLRLPLVFGTSRAPSPTENFNIHRRGDSLFSRFLFAVTVRFWDVVGAVPYREVQYLPARFFITLHSALFPLHFLVILFLYKL